MKLNVKRPQGSGPPKKITQCPACGYKGIEWKLSRENLHHTYVCRDCGYEGDIILEMDGD